MSPWIDPYKFASTPRNDINRCSPCRCAEHEPHDIANNATKKQVERPYYKEKDMAFPCLGHAKGMSMS